MKRGEKRNAEYQESYQNGFGNKWEQFEVETTKRVWYEASGTLDGEEVFIRFRPVDNFADVDDDVACDWEKFWVFDEDLNLIGTENDFKLTNEYIG